MSIQSSSFQELDKNFLETKKFYNVLAFMLNEDILYLATNYFIVAYNLLNGLQLYILESHFSGCDLIVKTNCQYIILIRNLQSLFIVNLKFKRITFVNKNFFKALFYPLKQNFLICVRNTQLRYYSNILKGQKLICKLEFKQMIMYSAISVDCQYIAVQLCFDSEIINLYNIFKHSVVNKYKFNLLSIGLLFPHNDYIILYSRNQIIQIQIWNNKQYTLLSSQNIQNAICYKNNLIYISEIYIYIYDLKKYKNIHQQQIKDQNKQRQVRDKYSLQICVNQNHSICKDNYEVFIIAGVNQYLQDI